MKFFVGQCTLFVALVIGLAFGFQGCAHSSSNSIQTQCVLNSDQANTITGKWANHPIPLSIQAVDFSASEQQAISAAVNSWNTFFQASKQLTIYNAGGTSTADFTVQNSSTRVSSATVCNTPIITPSGFSNYVYIYKMSSGWSFGSSAIAVTSTCPVTSNVSSQFQTMTAAVMNINYQNYFTGGNPVPDLQSILTHELGHLLGLAHSCGQMNNGSSVDCSNPDYQSAIMYPYLGFNGSAGIVKSQLQANDEERANCLYP